MVRKSLVFVFLSMALAVPELLFSSAPEYIPVQGLLEDSDGNPVSGELSMHFALYDSEVGGNMIWYETQNVHVDDGFFVVYLGEVERIDLEVFRDYNELWFGIQVESDEEMERVFFGTVPYSGFA